MDDPWELRVHPTSLHHKSLFLSLKPLPWGEDGIRHTSKCKEADNAALTALESQGGRPFVLVVASHGSVGCWPWTWPGWEAVG